MSGLCPDMPAHYKYLFIIIINYKHDDGEMGCSGYSHTHGMLWCSEIREMAGQVEQNIGCNTTNHFLPSIGHISATIAFNFRAVLGSPSNR